MKKDVDFFEFNPELRKRLKGYKEKRILWSKDGIDLEIYFHKKFKIPIINVRFKEAELKRIEIKDNDVFVYTPSRTKGNKN